MFTRRRMIQATSALLALSAVAAGGVWEGASLPPPAMGALCLSARELGLVQALAEALFPPGSALGVSAVGMDLAAEVDELIGDRLDPVVRPVFRLAMEGLDDGTWVSRGARFVDLPIADRVAVLAHWADNAVLARRMTYDALRTVVGMVFFCRPEVTAAIGFRPGCGLASAVGVRAASDDRGVP